MEKLSVFEAKARFFEVVSRAEHGKPTLITKRGRTVAKLVPVREAAKRSERAAVMEEILAFSRTIKLGKKLSLRELRGAIESGRR